MFIYHKQSDLHAGSVHYNSYHHIDIYKLCNYREIRLYSIDLSI